MLFLKRISLLLLVLACLVCFSCAYAGEPLSLGNVAENILSPVKGAASVFSTACYILGAAILAGAFIRYVEHRKNPVQIRLSQPVMLLILGLLLIALPLIGSYSASIKATGKKQREIKHGKQIPSL